MPPVISPKAMRLFKHLANESSLIDALTSQQQTVISDSLGNPVLRLGVLPQFPVFGNKYTSGWGVDVIRGGNDPIIRMGQLVWTGGPGGAYSTVNGIMFCDDAGNPRLVCDFQGMAEFNTSAVFTGWLYGPF